MPNILQALRSKGGLASSAELQALMGVSQPTVSRGLAPLLATGQVRGIGAARAKRYALPRHVADVGSDIAIMRVDSKGTVTPFARMMPLPGGRFWVDEADGVSQLHDGLPWFLNDMRPQGFMASCFSIHF